MSKEEAMDVKEFHEIFTQARDELGRVVVGQERVIEHLLVAVFAGGHVLLTGMPGLGRTLMVKTLAQILGLEFRRLQFTPDLLPTDIIGAEVLEGHAAGGQRRFKFFKGPVFANMVLADEVNRSPNRTQSALLELMQERQVTSCGTTHFLPKPFTLVATQNTLDTEGIWFLGEAQSDRFIMCIEQDYPDEAAEGKMVEMTTGNRKIIPKQVATPEKVLAMMRFAKDVPVIPSVKRFALSIVRASRPHEKEAVKEVAGEIRLGASPRAAQSMLQAAKVLALARGRQHVSKQDVLEVARPVMCHRLSIDFRAQAKGRTARHVLETLLAKVQERSVPQVSMWTRELLKQL